MNDKIYKQFIAETKVDEDERTVTAVISTDMVDRDGEVLLPKGVDFEQYLKNPVVQWAHSYGEPPIARTQWITKGRKQITAKAQFADTVFADEIYQLYKKNYLSAFSVGFIPKKSHTPTPDEIKKRPEWAEASRIFDEWELLEFSAVPVPANPEALATAVKTKEISVSKELQEQLGIDEDETFYPTNTNSDAKAVDVKSKISVGEKVDVHIVKDEPDYDKLIGNAMKKKVGIMYGE
ncbi:hypothetical protein LCGC14_0421350 [marine sediment metagenome]|uniref:Prohead serine protease domain-containing protein n=1 Tax=marine sediment metagenome TaxID=412755 RepID=A0A0F9W042_9ZZZZ